MSIDIVTYLASICPDEVAVTYVTPEGEERLYGITDYSSASAVEKIAKAIRGNATAHILKNLR